MGTSLTASPAYCLTDFWCNLSVQAMAKYNSHPEVASLARLNQQDPDDSDVPDDPLVLNKKMATTIRNWMKIPESVRSIVEDLWAPIVTS